MNFEKEWKVQGRRVHWSTKLSSQLILSAFSTERADHNYKKSYINWKRKYLDEGPKEGRVPFPLVEFAPRSGLSVSLLLAPQSLVKENSVTEKPISSLWTFFIDSLRGELSSHRSSKSLIAPRSGLRTLLVERMKRGMPGIAPLLYQDLAWKSLYPRLDLVKLFFFWGDPAKKICLFSGCSPHFQF